MRPSPSTDAETLPQFTVMLTRSGIFHWSFVDRRDTNWAIARVTALAYDDDDGATFDVAERAGVLLYLRSARTMSVACVTNRPARRVPLRARDRATRRWSL